MPAPDPVRMSSTAGSDSTINPIAPTQTIGLRPMRSERMPSSGIVISATTITAICSSCEVVSETPESIVVVTYVGMYEVSM